MNRMSHRNQTVSTLTLNPNQQHMHNASQKKRKYDENVMDYEAKENKGTESPSDIHVTHQRKFLAVPRHGQVYETQTVHPKQPPLYVPIMDDLLINTDCYEQISFSAGQCFLADNSGTYADTQEGPIINFWKYDGEKRQLHISRSFFFRDDVMYLNLRKQLENL